MAENWWRLFTAFIIGAPWGTYIGPSPLSLYANQKKARRKGRGGYRAIFDEDGNDGDPSSVFYLRAEISRFDD